MPIEFDPSKVPQPTDAMLKMADRIGLLVINIICDFEGAKSDDSGGVAFATLAPAVPSKGDRIKLENERYCEVRRVYWKVVVHRDVEGRAEWTALMPTVYAIATSSNE